MTNKTFEDWYKEQECIRGAKNSEELEYLAYKRAWLEGRRQGLLEGQRICKEAIEAVYGEQSFNDKWEAMDT